MVMPIALSSRTRTALLVTASAVCAFALRLAVSYQAVFGGDFVAFVETDAWYHMRLVDALIRDFPHRIWFDPYLQHPGGEPVGVGPFFDWVIAAVSLLLGLGSPSERLVDQIGAVVPAVFGALTIVPVYVLGRELFSRRAGLWSAAIVGALPGDILRRSRLGFTDHHCAEVLFSSLALMFLVLALSSAGTHRRRLAYALLGGVGLGCYLLTWSGGALLVAIIVAWATLQMVIEGLRGRAGTEVAFAVVPGLFVAGLMILPWTRPIPSFTLQMIAVGAGVVIVLFLRGLAVATQNLVRGRTVYLAALLITGAASVLLAGWMARDSTDAVFGQLARFSPGRTLALAGEAQPLMLSVEGGPLPLWKQFTTSLFLAVFGLGAAVPVVSRGLQAPGVLFLVWTGGMLLATVGQVRFSYYLAVNVALCAGYGCDQLLARIWPARDDELPVADMASPPGAPTGTTRKLRPAMLVAVAGLAALVLVPNLGIYRTLAKVPARPNSAWVDALNWLRSNTPDPFGNPEVYYGRFSGAASSDVLVPPRSAYGVLSWWDYGYWIIRQGRRVPIANPRQTGVREAATLLMAEDEAEATAIADSLGARYVIVNRELQARLGEDNRVMAGFLKNMAGALGKEVDRYIRVAYAKTAKGREPVILYEPAYYRTMMSRLYRSGHDPVSSREVAWVVTLERREWRGLQYWELLRERSFSDYEAAQALVEAARSPNVLLVGKDPFVSCVPLQPLQEFVRVFRSLERDRHEDRAGPSVVQIFERAPAARRTSDPRPSRIDGSATAAPPDRPEPDRPPPPAR